MINEHGFQHDWSDGNWWENISYIKIKISSILIEIIWGCVFNLLY